MKRRGEIGRNCRDCKAQSQPQLARYARRGLPADFCIIIGKTDQAERKGYKKHNPNKCVVKPRPKQGRAQHGQKDQQAPHRGRARFGKMPLRSIGANGLAFALTATQHIDQRRTK